MKQEYKLGVPILFQFVLPLLYFIIPDHVRHRAKSFFHDREFFDVIVANLNVERIHEFGFSVFLEEAVQNKIFLAHLMKFTGKERFMQLKDMLVLWKINSLIKDSG